MFGKKSKFVFEIIWKYFADKEVMETVIEIFDIKKNYQLKNETIDVLKGINMNDDSEIQPIKQGEFLMIRGSSGGGKSR